MILLTDERRSEIEISGTRSDFNDLVRSLRIGAGEIPSASNTSNDKLVGYTVILRGIRISPIAQESVNIRISPDKIVLISGSLEKLGLLGASVKAFVDEERLVTKGQVESHMHVEFYEGHFFLSSDAIPIVFRHLPEG